MTGEDVRVTRGVYRQRWCDNESFERSRSFTVQSLERSNNEDDSDAP